MKHLRARFCHGKHFIIAYAVKLFCGRIKAGVCGINALHIGVYFADFCSQGGGKRHGGGIRTAAAEGCNVAVRRCALKAGNDHGSAGAKLFYDSASIYLCNFRFAVMAVRKNSCCRTGK